MTRRAFLLAMLLASAAGFAGLSASRSFSYGSPTAVRVTLLDGRARLAPASVHPGAVRFVIVDAGRTAAGFAIGGRRTGLLSPGQRAALTVSFATPGRYPYRLLGKRPGSGALTVAAAPSYSLVNVGTFDAPLLVTAPAGDADRLFVVEQGGKIRLLVDGVELAEPFLDLSAIVHDADEDGLLSMVFAPDYATSGRFYVYYNDLSGNVHIVEYRRSANDPDVADPNSRRELLKIAKPYSNHNAGMMQFGPDGYLYIAVGDGDSGVKNKPGAFAQTLDDLLGNILRIDVNHGDPYTVPADNPFIQRADARPEVWDYGLRNPWRFWIDPPTGDIYIGDVQLGGPEEIDYVKGNAGGKNFGWPCYQGTVAFDATATCPEPRSPIAQYSHDGSTCAVIGGVTAHDPSLPTLNGYYLFGDLCSGTIKAFRVTDSRAVNQHPLKLVVPALDSFGVDGVGHVYAVSGNGPVYRITSPSTPR